MKQNGTFHILTVGWGHTVVDRLWQRIEVTSNDCFSHIVHPRYTPDLWPSQSLRPNLHFFRSKSQLELPLADRQLLASLEQDGVPTLHNMIMGDRVVSKLAYDDSLRYATFLAKKLLELFSRVEPSVVIGGFDAIHSGIALAVAKQMNIPWFALHFSVIPPGLACLCDGLSPATRVAIRPTSDEQQSLARASLELFERKRIQAPAYIAPPPLSVAKKIAKFPQWLSGVGRLLQRSREQKVLKFTEARSGHNVGSALQLLRRANLARNALSRSRTITHPPDTPYIFFGLHLQPESSIDVWAPFFSNQMWVIELLSRSIPPTHRLLIKIHKSDVSNYSRKQLEHMQSFPGVDLVAPFVDSRDFIENASLIVVIQGTIGLEAALLGKPVIMLGDSPVTIFPSATQIGEISNLPKLIRAKLGQRAPSREDVVAAYASFLTPFFPASHNDWTSKISDDAIKNYVRLFSALKRHATARDTDLDTA